MMMRPGLMVLVIVGLLAAGYFLVAAPANEAPEANLGSYVAADLKFHSAIMWNGGTLAEESSVGYEPASLLQAASVTPSALSLGAPYAPLCFADCQSQPKQVCERGLEVRVSVRGSGQFTLTSPRSTIEVRTTVDGKPMFADQMSVHARRATAGDWVFIGKEAIRYSGGQVSGSDKYWLYEIDTPASTQLMIAAFHPAPGHTSQAPFYYCQAFSSVLYTKDLAPTGGSDPDNHGGSVCRAECSGNVATIPMSITGNVEAKNVAQGIKVEAVFTLKTAAGDVYSKTVATTIGREGGAIGALGHSFEGVPISTLVGVNTVTVKVVASSKDLAGNALSDDASLVKEARVDGKGNIELTIKPATFATTGPSLADGRQVTVRRTLVPVAGLAG